MQSKKPKNQQFLTFFGHKNTSRFFLRRHAEFRSDRGQDDFGLGWYEFGARMYDPSIGRWNGVDALADYYFAVSPYNYALNSPMITVDPNGMGTWRIWNIDEKNAAFGDAGEQKFKKYDDPPSKERDNRTVEKDGVVENLPEVNIQVHRTLWNKIKHFLRGIVSHLGGGNMFTMDADVGQNNDTRKGGGSNTNITCLMQVNGIKGNVIYKITKDAMNIRNSADIFCLSDNTSSDQPSPIIKPDSKIVEENGGESSESQQSHEPTDTIITVYDVYITNHPMGGSSPLLFLKILLFTRQTYRKFLLGGLKKYAKLLCYEFN